MLGQMPGMSEYWKRIKGDAMAQERQFGPCHLFLTLNLAEYVWLNLLAELKAKNPDIDFDEMQQSRGCILDPVTVAMHWN